MDEVNEEITIAQNRADEIIFENASVFMRSKLYEALPGSDEEKLKKGLFYFVEKKSQRKEDKIKVKK